MDDVERLKSSIKVSDLLFGEGYKLQKNGNGFKCSCINEGHIDRKPSMTIKDEIGFFKCWSCPAKGDIFNALHYMKPELKSFRDKIEYLDKNYYGKTIDKPFFLQGKKEKQSNHQDDKDFIKIMNYITIYCSLQLPKSILDDYLLSNKKLSYRLNNGEVVYMNGYGLSKEIIEEFQIGFCPNKKELFNELLEEFDKKLIDKIGFFDKRGMPIFKGRIVVPYLINGNTVYFTARQTDLTPKNEFEQAKYKVLSINNKYLYNQDDIGSLSVFVTEGEFDTLALKNIGYNSISLGGIEKDSKINDKIIKQLKQSYLVYICFDNDNNKAGNNKAVELQKLLKKKGVDSTIITLPLKNKKKKIDISEYLGKYSKKDFNKLLIF